MYTGILRELRFLSGGGEAGSRLRAEDWPASPLGPPAEWPQSLKTAVRFMLTTGHPVAIYWGQRSIFLFNDAYASLIGAERRASAMGRPGPEVWNEIWDVLSVEIDQVMAGDGATWHENTLIPLFRDGKVEDAYWTYSYGPIDDDTQASGVGGVLVITTETTAQVVAERRAASEAERFARLFEQSPTFMAIVNGPEHRIEFANPGYLSIVGRRSLVGRTVAEALPDAVAQGYLDRLDAVYQTGEAFTAQGARYDVQAVPGGPIDKRFIDLVCQPIVDELGNVTGVFVEGVDVTARTDANEALRQAEAQLRAVLQAIPGVVYVKDRDGRMLVANNGVADLVGKPLDAIIGKTDLEFLDDKEQAAAVMETDRRIMARGESDVIEEAVSLPDGTPAIWLSTKTPFRDAEGEVIGLIGSSIDFTDQRRAREVLSQSRAELERQVEERTTALMATEEQLRQSQKMEAVGQLTGGIAHDFNNLLAGITLSLEMLETRIRAGRVEAAQRYIDAAQSSAKRAAALTQRLLAFSRRQTLDPSVVNLNQLVEGMADLLRQSIGPAIDLSVQEASDPWLTRVDPHQLENALLNLCINARDAMPDGGRLRIETATESLAGPKARRLDLEAGDYVTLAVVDTGCGMAPEVIERAFDPFFTTKPLGAGTGLGLSMIYGFVRQSRGQVEIESKVGRGTTVRIFLPRELAVLELVEVALAPPAHHVAAGGETVLVIDDETAVRMMVVDRLQETGYRVLEAADGVSGHDILKRGETIDLLITDVGLPGGMNGRQVADAARALLPGLKVLFITGYAEGVVLKDSPLDARTRIIAKPFGIETLHGEVRNLLSDV